MNPLLHIHHSQNEEFYVREGTGVWTIPNHDDPAKRQFTVSASAKSEEGRKVFIPLGEYHRFENLDPNQILVIEANYSEPEYEVEEIFFRNFLTYLSDCEKARMAPSVYQLNGFLHQFKCPPALPVPGPKTMDLGLQDYLSRILRAHLEKFQEQLREILNGRFLNNFVSLT
ncbi:MAG: hypothetical protein Q9165_007048 [Trypethelium subeluteriae]